MPLTLTDYEATEFEAPFLALDKEISASKLANGMAEGYVYSNFPMRYLYCQLLDEGGNMVADLWNVNRSTLDLHKMAVSKNIRDLFKDAKSGTKYTFKLYGGLCAGEALLAEVEFTLN